MNVNSDVVHKFAEDTDRFFRRLMKKSSSQLKPSIGPFVDPETETPYVRIDVHWKAEGVECLATVPVSGIGLVSFYGDRRADNVEFKGKFPLSDEAPKRMALILTALAWKEPVPVER